MKLEIDTDHIDVTTRDIIRALGKRHSLVEWMVISSAKVDELSFIVINALYENKEGVLKIAHQKWNEKLGCYDDIDVKLFPCTTLQQAIETAHDAIKLMLAGITKEHA